MMRARLVSALAFGGVAASVPLYGLVRQLVSGEPVRDVLLGTSTWLLLGVAVPAALAGALAGRRIAEARSAGGGAALGAAVVAALMAVVVVLGWIDASAQYVRMGGSVSPAGLWAAADGLIGYPLVMALIGLPFYVPVGMAIGYVTWRWLHRGAPPGGPA